MHHTLDHDSIVLYLKEHPVIADAQPILRCEIREPLDVSREPVFQFAEPFCDFGPILLLERLQVLYCLWFELDLHATTEKPRSCCWLTLTAARAKLRPRAKRRPQFGVGLAGLLGDVIHSQRQKARPSPPNFVVILRKVWWNIDANQRAEPRENDVAS